MPSLARVTGQAGTYLRLKNPGRRSTRAQSVQARSPPKPAARILSIASCSEIEKPSTRQRTWHLPGDVRMTTEGRGTSADARIVSNFRSPSSSKSRYKARSEEHTSELQSLRHLVCRLLLSNR